jgi:hypothetical protein
MDYDMSIKDEDFVIRVRPSHEEGKWTGEIDISIISNAENPLDLDSYSQLMHFCKMMCATIPIMEDNEEIRDLAHNFVLDIIDDDEVYIGFEPEKSVEISHEGDNIIRLNFGTKTKGNA